jgi:hypothetical protein
MAMISDPPPPTLPPDPVTVPDTISTHGTPPPTPPAPPPGVSIGAGVTSTPPSAPPGPDAGDLGLNSATPSTSQNTNPEPPQPPQPPPGSSADSSGAPPQPPTVGDQLASDGTPAQVEGHASPDSVVLTHSAAVLTGLIDDGALPLWDQGAVVTPDSAWPAFHAIDTVGGDLSVADSYGTLSSDMFDSWSGWGSGSYKLLPDILDI